MIVNPTLGPNKLKPIEIDVLAKMFYIDYLYKNLKKEDRDKIIFHKETSKKIRESLSNMSEASYNNIKMKLRKKGMINSGGLLVRPPLKDNTIEINYKLTLE